ncbi:unnamed protein product [Symbiodinium microadriaticum]|nr:unnamed protein product [Symbiodinium microadriaticum]
MPSTLTEALAQEKQMPRPAQGPCALVLLTTGETCRGVIINANHALCDGRAMFHYLQAFLTRLSADDLQVTPRTPDLPADWGQCISDDAASPDFLPLPGSPLQIKDLRREGSGEPVFRRILEASTFTKVLAVGKESSASATGLLVAMLQDAIGSMYLEQAPADDSCVVAVEVLVDLRPMLEKEATVVQAIATVTTAAEVRRGAGRQDLLSLAKAASEDIRRRVARGEAHRQARLATSGKFDQCPPPGTVELSNLGMFPVTGHELLLDQRFDGFEGLSILAHTEGTGGPLRLLASVGDGVDGWAISEVLAGGLRQLAALAETGK